MTAALLLLNGGATAATRPPRLSVSDAYFVTPDGALHRRKSITAFTLPKRAATGRQDDALRFMDWAVGEGFNEFRVFTRVNWTGPPGIGVESGWDYDETACAWVLEQAADRGCYVELVACTYGSAVEEAAAHLASVDALCQAHENALLEVWNEPQQNGGNDLLAAVLSRYTPKTPGWASGCYTATPYPAGQSVTYHSPRDNEWPRKFKDAYEFSTGAGPTQPFTPGFHGPVHLDEPPQVEVTAVPDDWEAYGAGGALFANGGTMHGNPDFQRCVIPTRTDVLACCRAFLRGMDAVPMQRYSGYFHPDDQGSLRRYWRWGADGKKYEISVRPYAFGTV